MPATKRQFETAYKKWRKAIADDAKVQLSSRPQDYTALKEYRALMKLGKGALPFVLEKIQKGDFLLNQAALDLAKIKMEGVVAMETKQPVKQRVEFMAQRKKPAFLSEQQKAELILKHLGEKE